MKFRNTLLLSVLALAAASCSATRYGDAEGVETVNVDWGSTDLQTFSGTMVESLLAAPQLSYLAKPEKGDDQRIKIFMGDISNETSEHINVKDIQRMIRTDLLGSGKFRFAVGEQGQGEIGDQVRFQQGSGRVDPAQAIAFGRQIGAEVVVYGSLSSIVKKKGRSIESGGSKTKDVYYLCILNAVNIETGEMIWSDKGELRKTARTGLLGSD